MRYSIELDIVHADDEPVEEAARSLLEAPDAVTIELTDEEGPAGGWPVIRFTSDDPAVIVDLLLAYHEGDAGDALYSAVAGVTRVED